MKFKDNAFYKAVAELKEKNNNLKPKKIEDDEKYFYDFDIGVSLVLANLLKLSLNNDRYSVEIELDFADFESNRVHSPDEAFELLKNREIKDLVSISIKIDYEIWDSYEKFYFYPEKNEIELFSTYNYKDYEEEEDPYDIY